MRSPARGPLLLLLPLAVMAPPASTGQLYDPGRVGWSRVELEASKLWITAYSDVELSRFPAARAAAELFRPAAGAALAPAGAESFLMAIRTRVLSQDSRVRFWFDPGDARALERSELKLTRKRSRDRTLRYAAGGVHVHTVEPGDGERGLPPESWTAVDDRFIAIPAGSGGVAITEPAALLYAVPAAPLAAVGDAIRLHVFSHRRINEVEVTVAAREKLEVDYVEVGASGEREVAGEVEALRVTLRPRPVAGREDEGAIKLLGLQGDIDLYLDPRTRAPLLVSGRIAVVGRVRLRARRVVLR